MIEQALALSRGSPLGGVPWPFADAERTRLADFQAVAVERWAEALVHLGRSEEALAHLQELLAHHPLRERSRELLMLALFHSGRQAEALEVFAAGQRVLAEELGVDPGEGLRKTHELILRGSGIPLRDVPHQLPRRLSGFVGRGVEVTRLTTLLTPLGDEPPHPFVAICGPPGVAKSALAVHVAHGVRALFPDGQLFVNLRAATPGVAPLTALDVLSRFLRALGVAGQEVPSDLDEAAALWRSRLDGRRLLILLDDVADLEQIELLLTAPLGSSVIVTSRESLAAGDDCEQLILGKLSSSESSTMLAKLAGAERVEEQPADTELVVEMCDGLPLALRVAGARLAERRDWTMSALAERLRDERTRLHELQSGTMAVESSLASGWISLRDSTHVRDTMAARMLALLGVVHLPDITDEIAAALLGDSQAVARRALDRLAEAHLMEVGHGDRYQVHDLIRLFATSLEPEDGHDAMVRALSFMIVSVRRAWTLIDPHRALAPAPDLEVTPALLNDAKQAHDWLLHEEANLTSAARQTMSDADPEIARLGVALAFSLHWFQVNAYRLSDVLTLNHQALEVAGRLDDKVLACHAHNHLAFALLGRRRFTEAVEHREAELGYARQTGEYPEATLALSAALATARADGDLSGQAGTHMLLGEVCLDDHRLLDAVDHLRRAISVEQAVSSQIGKLRCLIRLSQAFRQLGQLAESLNHIEQAMPLAKTLGSEPWRKEAIAERAAVYVALGVPVVDVS